MTAANVYVIGTLWGPFALFFLHFLAPARPLPKERVAAAE
jgi:hypothetical protein